VIRNKIKRDIRKRNNLLWYAVEWGSQLIYINSRALGKDLGQQETQNTSSNGEGAAAHFSSWILVALIPRTDVAAGPIIMGICRL